MKTQKAQEIKAIACGKRNADDRTTGSASQFPCRSHSGDKEHCPQPDRHPVQGRALMLAHTANMAWCWPRCHAFSTKSCEKAREGHAEEGNFSHISSSANTSTKKRKRKKEKKMDQRAETLEQLKENMREILWATDRGKDTGKGHSEKEMMLRTDGGNFIEVGKLLQSKDNCTGGWEEISAN